MQSEGMLFASIFRPACDVQLQQTVTSIVFVSFFFANFEFGKK